MTDRERLEKLYEKATEEYAKTNKALFRKTFICDYLLANGVIVPPCKVGDKMYVLMKQPMQDYDYKKGVNEIEVLHVRKRKDGIFVSDFWGFIDWKIGERAFLTKEEAEQALAERNKND